MEPLQIGNLKIDVPIIQGGMGVCISLSGLAAAVANEGGVGIISAVGIGMTEPNYRKNFKESNLIAFRKQIRKARELSNGVIGANIMLAVSDYEDLLKVAIEEKLDMVILGAGLPLQRPCTISEELFQYTDTKFIPKVSSAKATRLIFSYWSSKHSRIPDAVVVEGPLAGGHLGFKKEDLEHSTFNLATIVKETKQVLKPFEQKHGRKIPIIAGGGIYTGSDIYKVMEAGANAVKMGTRFVTTYECDADIKFKESYLKASEEDITIIQSPVGLPGRVIRNEFVKQIQNGEQKPVKCPWKCLKNCNYKEVPYCIAEALFNAGQGDMENGFAFAGTNAYRATEIQSVKQVMASLVDEYHQAEHGLKLRVA
ncbi:MAG: nitronate monooxygenase family protein [Saprospiraceae bacterium]|nr:nitronate monooxygenase family protein [Saprospiraceae bacterium]